jgi:hypothetical protein
VVVVVAAAAAAAAAVQHSNHYDNVQCCNHIEGSAFSHKVY